MNINFALILVSLVALTGLIGLLDILLLAKRRGKEKTRPWYIEYARSFFPLLLIVLIIRSFIVEPFRIPSGSLEPTLLVGDFVVVNKFDYGLRWPVLNTKFLSVGEPTVGDIVVFRWPPDESIDYIKRFVAGPGDTIQYKNKVLYLNGKQQSQKFIGYTTDNDGQGHSWKVEIRSETINGVTHKIYVRPDVPAQNFSWTVPAGNYFAMGDNRDDSSDSRVWGFVPEANIVGKAFAVWMSWNNMTDSIRWSRIGHLIR